MESLILVKEDGINLAYDRVDAHLSGLPTVLFLGGFRSDRKGTKATHLYHFCASRQQPFVRFDYSGHGESGGKFEDGTIESWRDDALLVLDKLTNGPVILIGSSMGGWIGLLLTLMRPERIRAFIGIAAAPDFTRDIVDHRFDDILRSSYEAQGYVDIPNQYSPEPYRMTRQLIEAGNRCCVLNQAHQTSVPISLIQGRQDTEVKADMPERIKAAFPGAVRKTIMIEDGDHSLSRPQDLSILEEMITSACT